MVDLLKQINIFRAFLISQNLHFLLMLMVDPTKRITANEALDHHNANYFTDYHIGNLRNTDMPVWCGIPRLFLNINLSNLFANPPAMHSGGEISQGCDPLFNEATPSGDDQDP